MSEDSVIEYDGYIARAQSCEKRAEAYEQTEEFLRAKDKYEEAVDNYDRAAEVAWVEGDGDRARIAEYGSQLCRYQADDMIDKHISAINGQLGVL